MQVHLTEQNETDLKQLSEMWNRSVAFIANDAIRQSILERNRLANKYSNWTEAELPITATEVIARNRTRISKTNKLLAKLKRIKP